MLTALVIPVNQTPSLILETIKDKQTWELFIVVPCTLAFASVMEQKGLLTKLANVLEGMGARIGSTFVTCHYRVGAHACRGFSGCHSGKESGRKLEN